MDKRKAARWNKTFEKFDDAEYLYRREYWVFRKIPRWLTKEEVNRLITTACNVFNVPRPRVSVTRRKEMRSGSALGSYSYDSGIWISLTKEYMPKRSHKAVDDACTKAMIHYYNVPAGTASACTVLHELAHHFSYEWWGNGLHDAVFSSVNEMLHEWYSRSRPKYGVKRRMKAERKANW